MRVPISLVPELEVGNEIKIYYIDANEKRTLLKKLTVQDVLLPKLQLTNTLTERSESIGYKITNYDERFKEGSIIAKVQKDEYEESITGIKGSIAVSGLKANTPLKLYYVNKNDIKFYLMTVNTKAVKSTKLTVPTVTDRTKTFIVTYEANSVVTLTNGKKTYNGKKLKNGQYQFTIPLQKAGTNLTVTATNSVGDEQTKTIIVQGKTGTTDSSTKPPKLTVPTVTDRTTTFKVTYEKNSKVTLTDGKEIYNGKELKNGEYEFTIPSQKAGTSLTVTAINSTGDKQTKTIIVKGSSGTTEVLNHQN